MKPERVTIYLYPEHIKFLERLQRVMKGYTISECIRFCINLANAMLNYSPYSDKMYEILIKAVEDTIKEKEYVITKNKSKSNKE